MTELTLIRHGQAISGARSEADYDRLSPLGRQQARWLGDYLAYSGGFDRIVSGTLRRQRETAEALNIGARPHWLDPRLNELDYFALAQALQAERGTPFPDSAEAFADHIPQVLDFWRDARADDTYESYDDFRARVMAVMRDAAAEGPGAVLVTSTGVIATLCALALGLEAMMKARIFLHILNTSVHRFEYRGGMLYLTQFCATPHLDPPARHAARTHF